MQSASRPQAKAASISHDGGQGDAAPAIEVACDDQPAIWSQENGGAVFAGAVAALAMLAVVLIGKGSAALQERAICRSRLGLA